MLPVPSKPEVALQTNGSHSDLEAVDPEPKVTAFKDKHYRNARWWRGLNRLMAIVGVAIIITIVSSAVLCVRSGGLTRVDCSCYPGHARQLVAFASHRDFSFTEPCNPFTLVMILNVLGRLRRRMVIAARI